MLASVAGLPAFLAYVIAALALVALYLYVYMWITPHDEFALIRSNVTAAGVSMGMSLIGFSIPLSSAMRYAANIWDMIIWGVIALIVQIMVFFLSQIVFPDLAKRIEANEIPAALFVGSASLAAGILNAAAMSY
ncbi:DUF350 domain-containing protein [Terrarubrum flagellatum]|uniref:DUF350 domain-containing protein n=1 Tax=Terrirubrum flagellatum TaxID=2895980 RepID=UPI00314555EB